MAQTGIKTVGDIHAMGLAALEQKFGSYAQRLYELAHGIDETPVVANRVRKQISAEDTFPEDIPLGECEMHIRRLVKKVWNASKENARWFRQSGHIAGNLSHGGTHRICPRICRVQFIKQERGMHPGVLQTTTRYR